MSSPKLLKETDIPGPYNTIADRPPKLGDYIIARYENYNSNMSVIVYTTSYGKIVGFDKDEKKEIIRFNKKNDFLNKKLSYEKNEYVIIEQDKNKTVRNSKYEILERYNHLILKNDPPEVGKNVISMVNIGFKCTSEKNEIGRIISLDEENEKAIIEFREDNWTDYVLSYEDFLVVTNDKKSSNEDFLVVTKKNHNIPRLSRSDVAYLSFLLCYSALCIVYIPYHIIKMINIHRMFGKSPLQVLAYVLAICSYVFYYLMLADLVKDIQIYNKLKDEGNSISKDEGNSISNAEGLDLTVLEDTNDQEVIETYECNGIEYKSWSGTKNKLKNKDIKLPGHYDKIVSDVPNVGDNVIIRISFTDYKKKKSTPREYKHPMIKFFLPPPPHEVVCNAQGRVIRVNRETKRAYIEFESGFKREFSYKHKEFVVFKQDLSLKKPKLEDTEILDMSIGSDKRVTIKNRNPKVDDKIMTRIRVDWNERGSIGKILNLSECNKLAFIKLENDKHVNLCYHDFAIINLKEIKKEKKLNDSEIIIPEKLKNKEIVEDKPVFDDDVITRVSCDEYPSNTLGKIVNVDYRKDEITIEIKETNFILKNSEVAIIK